MYRLKRILFVIIFILFNLAILYPLARLSLEPSFKENFIRNIESRGELAWLYLLLIQIIQVVIAVIPGEVVELASGVLYGPLYGTLIALLGCLIGTAIVFSFTKKVSDRMLKFFFEEDEIAKWNWIKDSRRNMMIVFLLFLIPGTPKDLLTYIYGNSKLALKKFLLITGVARIPSILSSTAMGSSYFNADYTSFVIVLVITTIIAVLAMLYNEYIFKNLKGD